jgi:uncharacterized protein YggE
MKRIIWCVLAAIALLPLGAAEPELTGTPTQLKDYLSDVAQVITLTGQEDLQVNADRVIFTLSIATEAETLDGALKALREKKDSVVKGLKAKGVAPEKILTMNLPVVPLYRVATADKSERFKAATYVRVCVDNDKDFEVASDFINAAKEVVYEGMTYELVDETGPKVKALETICADIDRRKQVYEAKFGVLLKLKGLKEEAEFLKGEQVQIEGNVSGLKVNRDMGQFVLRMKVQAQFVIQTVN